MSEALSGRSDPDVVALALSGRQDAYRELLRRYREPVFRTIRASTGHEQDALELTQETFIAAFGALSRFDRARPILPWLRRIALNKCRDWARRHRLRSMLRFAAPIEAAYDVMDSSAPADVQAADRAELARVTAAIARLPTRLREVMVLRTLEDLSQSETAEALRISEKAVEARLYRARSKLTDLLRDSSRKKF